ncbi:MAG: hypothetical protein ABIS45_02940, partial [Burkholderiales bacterium]
AVASLAARAPSVVLVTMTNSELHQFRRQCRKTAVIALSPAVINENVLAFDVTEFAKACAESLKPARDSRSRGRSQKSNASNF